jgi:hypothetical protein
MSDSRSKFSYRDISHTALRGHVNYFRTLPNSRKLANEPTPMLRRLAIDTFDAVKASGHPRC